MRATPGPEPQGPDHVAVSLNAKAKPDALIVVPDAARTGDTTAVRWPGEQLANPVAVRVLHHAAAPGASSRSRVTPLRYFSIATSISAAVVGRPILKRMALCASASERPSARNT